MGGRKKAAAIAVEAIAAASSHWEANPDFLLANRRRCRSSSAIRAV